MSEKLGPVDIEFVLKNVNFKQEAGRIKAEISGISSTAKAEVEQTNSIMRTLGSGMAAYFSFQGVKGFGSELIRVRGEFEGLGIAFETMLGSKEKAEKLMAEITALAASTPFSLTEVAAGAKQLLAVQVPANEVKDTLTKIGDISSGLNVPMSQLIKAYGDVKAKGRLMGQEMLQFMGAGVPMVAELAKHFNVAESEVSKMVESGVVGYEDMKAVIEQLAGEGGMFFNLMEKQSKSLTGMVSNLGDAWDRMLNQIGEGNQDTLKGSISLLINLVENYEKVIDILKVIAITYGTYKAATIASAIATNGLTIAETLHYTALLIAEKAQKLLNKTMLANPYVAVATLLAGIVTSLIVFGKQAKEVSIAQQAMARVSETVSDSLAKQKGEIDQLQSSAKNQELTDKQRLEAINKLKEIIPGYNAELSEEGRLINENTAAVEAYLKQLELKIKMTAVQDEMADLWKKERDELKLLSDAQEKYNKQQLLKAELDKLGSVSTGVGGAGMGGNIVNETAVLKAEAVKKKAQDNLEETRQALQDLKKEYSSAEKSLADFFKAAEGGNSGEKTIKTIKDLEQELSVLEKSRKEATSISDSAELDRLAKLIIAKRQEIEKFKIESQKSDKRTDLEQFEDEIKKKKELYTQYEAYKKVVGESEAQEMYANLIKQGDDYQDYLKRTLTTLPAGDKKAIVATELVGFEKKQTGDDADKVLADLLERTKTYNQKRRELEKKYQDDAFLLFKNGKSEELDVLDKVYQEQVAALNAKHMEEDKSYTWIFGKLEKMGRKALKSYIDRLKEEIALDKYKADEMLEARLKLEEKLADAEDKLENLFVKNLSEAVGLFKELAGLAGLFGEEMEGAAQVGIDYLTSMADGVEKAASGDIMGAASASISGQIDFWKKMYDSFSKSGKMTKETEALTKATNERNESLSRQAAIINSYRGSEQLAAYDALLAKVNKQLESAKRKMEALADTHLGEEDRSGWNNEQWLAAIEGSSGAQQEQLLIVYNHWIELQQAQQDYFDQQTELATGTSFDGLVDGMLEALVAGERSVEDFADNVEELLRKAIIQGFKTKYLIDALEPWYEQFGQMAADGLSAKEIEALREQLQQIMVVAGVNLDAVESILGDSANLTNSAEGLSGAIKGMSQESADLMAGQLGGMRIHLADIAAVLTAGNTSVIQVAPDSLMATSLSSLNSTMTIMRDAAMIANQHLFQIEVNTRKLANIEALLSTSNTPYSGHFLDNRINGR